MTTYAFCNAAGQIQYTLSQPLTDQAQLSALQAQGITMISVPDGTTGANAMIDMSTQQVVSINPNPSLPNVVTQLAAALINNGTVDASAFHPATITSMNTSLAAANMSAISLPSATPASSATTSSATSPSAAPAA